MGAVSFSIDKRLVKLFKKLLPLEVFVETGTFKGDTLDSVKDLFEKIYSVDLSEEYYNYSKNRFKDQNHINIYLDDSKKFLRDLFPVVNSKSVLYWLDAHWCVADKSAGEKSQCPLIDELKAINNLNQESVIIIDDARLFIAPPPYPHEVSHWPNLEMILKQFRKLSSNHGVIILNDNIIFYPLTVQDKINDFAYRHSINWLTVLDKSRDYDKILTELNNKEKVLLSLTAGLQEKESQIALLAKENSILENEIKLLTRELNDKEERVKTLLSEIDKKEEQIKLLYNGLIKKDEEYRVFLDENNALREKLQSKDNSLLSLTTELKKKEDEILLFRGENIEKENQIKLLAEELNDKEDRIKVLLNEMDKKEELLAASSGLVSELDEQIIDLNHKIKELEESSIIKELRAKEEVIGSLNETLSILRKRLSNPFWGILTLVQHMFPKFWDFLYRMLIDSRVKQGRKNNYKKLGFFIPRLGILKHHDPIELNVRLLEDKSYSRAKPRLSIVIPSFNQAEFLERTIRSVVEQNYTNLEFIIQDGNSNDASLDIIKKYENYAFVNSEKDKGQADAINRGFSRSSGEIMAWINSDDIYLPGAFNYVINYFNKHPGVDVVYSHRILIDENDKEIGRWFLPAHDKKVIYWADFIPQETLFWRRRIWEKIGSRLDDSLNFALDWDLLIRFQEAGAKIARLPCFLAAFRVHPAQKTSAHISSLGEQEMFHIRKKYLHREVSYSEIKKKILFYLIKSEIYNKLYRAHLLKY